MYPIPLASDTKVKKSIEEAIKNMQDGKIATIMDERKLREIIDQAKGIETVNITDTEKSTYIQYLAKYRDDLMRWFYSLYGMNSQGSSKLAQQTVDEVNQDSNASMILPHSMLKARQDGCKMAKDKFGWDMEVSFSECWMSRLANMDDEFKTTDEELEDEAPEGKEEEKDETERVSDKTVRVLWYSYKKPHFPEHQHSKNSMAGGSCQQKCLSMRNKYPYPMGNMHREIIKKVLN
jgi:hypothetical protein